MIKKYAIYNASSLCDLITDTVNSLDAPVLKGFKINGFPDRLPRTFLPDTGEVVGGTL